MRLLVHAAALDAQQMLEPNVQLWLRSRGFRTHQDPEGSSLSRQYKGLNVRDLAVLAEAACV
jgi:hypothetical protein